MKKYDFVRTLNQEEIWYKKRGLIDNLLIIYFSYKYKSIYEWIVLIIWLIDINLIMRVDLYVCDDSLMFYVIFLLVYKVNG